MPKKPSGKRASAGPSLVEFVSPEHIEGHRTSRVSADGDGHNEGFSLALTPLGVELTKPGAFEGKGRRLYPWGRVKHVEFDLRAKG